MTVEDVHVLTNKRRDGRPICELVSDTPLNGPIYLSPCDAGEAGRWHSTMGLGRKEIVRNDSEESVHEYTESHRGRCGVYVPISIQSLEKFPEP